MNMLRSRSLRTVSIFTALIAFLATEAGVRIALANAEAAPAAGDIPPLPMPKAKKKKKKAEVKGPVVDGCKFIEDGEPVPKEKRKPPAAEKIARQADENIEAAKSAGDANTKLAQLKEAQAALFDALKKDPYSAVATEKLAAVYALAGRRKCAKLMLGRLVTLRDAPTKEFAAAAKRAIQTAKSDPAFDAMRAEADRALE